MMGPDEQNANEIEIKDKLDEIAKEILSESKKSESADEHGFVMFNDESTYNLIIQLYEQRDRFPIFDLCLRALIEHLFIISRMNDNLTEAEELLRAHNIPFNSVVGEDDE